MRIAEKAESRMDTGGKGGEVGGRFRRDLRFQIGGSDAFPDQLLQLVRPDGFPGESQYPVAKQAIQLFQCVVEAALHHNRLHVID